MNRSVFLSVALALAACSSEAGQYQAITINTGIAEPGAYQETIMTRIEASGAEPRVKEKSHAHCLKEGDDPVRRELTEKFDRLCVGSTLRFEGGSIDGEANCLWSSSATERMTMHFSGSYDRTGSSLLAKPPSLAAASPRHAY